MPDSSLWLALMIGNSRLHWAWFIGDTVQEAWDSDHLPADAIEEAVQRWAAKDWTAGILPVSLRGQLFHTPGVPPLYLASVVPSQTELWQTYSNARVITLDCLGLEGLYPTLGIDRALAVLGAGQILGWPVLVIDAGTALTFTGADAQGRLVGGAILPGLRLQFESLGQRTAALPKVELIEQMPQRWALSTPEAIQSGIVYTVLAGIKEFILDWRRHFPDSQIALTGGDRTHIYAYLEAQYPEMASKITADPHLIFQGMQAAVKRLKG